MLWRSMDEGEVFVHERNGGDPEVFDQSVLRAAAKNLKPKWHADEMVANVYDKHTKVKFDVFFRRVTHLIKAVDEDQYISNLEMGRTVRMMDKDLVRQVMEIGVGSFGPVNPVRVFVRIKDRLPSHIECWYCTAVRVTPNYKVDAMTQAIARFGSEMEKSRAAAERTSQVTGAFLNDPWSSILKRTKKPKIIQATINTIDGTRTLTSPTVVWGDGVVTMDGIAIKSGDNVSLTYSYDET